MVVLPIAVNEIRPCSTIRGHEWWPAWQKRCGVCRHRAEAVVTRASFLGYEAAIDVSYSPHASTARG